MKLFYSWQSDVTEKNNRYFIQDALKSIEKEFSKENILNLTIDQATRDEPGSPNISETILRKIDSSSIFLADVTIINAKENNKKTPNPNVLIELGYAIKKHGFEKIILLFNSTYGKIEELPFDIRQNRILSYNFDGENKKASLDNLINKIKVAILSVDKKTVNADRIGITFYHNETDYGDSIEFECDYTKKISREEYLTSVTMECLHKYQSSKSINSWQRYLLNLIDDNRKQREAIQKHGMYIHPMEISGLSNPNYFEEYQVASLFRKNCIPLNFALKNSNEKSFKDVKVIFLTEKSNKIFRWADMPQYPSNSPILSIATSGLTSGFKIDERGDKISIEYDVELLHIGEIYEFTECLYLLFHPENNKKVTIYYTILFMDLPQIKGELSIGINIKNVKKYTGNELFEI